MTPTDSGRIRPAAFSVSGELPLGTTVLDASAGTGKTFAIAALVTRYVAELGIELGDLLIVTFTRAATAELRDRIRLRLLEARDHLAQELADATLDGPVPDDEVLRTIAGADRPELVRRHRRLADALDQIDTAAITTIHGYCQQVLAGLGLAADVPGEATLLEDEAPLIDAAARDLLVESFLERPGAPALKDVVAVIGAACADPDARILPAEEAIDPGSELEPSASELQPSASELQPSASELQPSASELEPSASELDGRVLADLARRGRQRVARRKEALGVIGHQDLLTRLRDTLREPTIGPAARDTIRERTSIVLVDEFQDTDRVQWAILSEVFDGPVEPNDPRALILIGDPKQAIYGFRGADVRAYLAATRASTARWTLETNWRSDGDLLASLDRLLDGTVYGETGIEHAPVRAAPGRSGSQLSGDPDLTVPLALRVVTEEGAPARPPTGTARHGLIADDVVAEVARTLRPGALDLQDRPVRPGDIAILVRANRDAHVLQRTLIDHGIPAVLNSVGSVFGTPAAVAWRDLLDAVRRPNDTSAARRVGVGPFSPVPAEALLDADDATIDLLHQHLSAWAMTLRDHGVTGLERRVATDGHLAARLLAVAGGERLLTDLQHIGALLHQAQGTNDLGPAGLVGWLDERIAAAEEEAVPPDEQARRLESDAQAVQILTIHRSKGLEFGIVLCPYLWVGSRAVTAPYVVADPAGTGRLIDVGPRERPGADVHRRHASEQQDGEGLRLIYVALTRARHRVVIWWSPPHNRQVRPLDRILFGRDELGRVAPADPDQPVDVPVAKDAADRVLPLLAPLAAACGGSLAQVPAVVTIPSVTPSDDDPPALERAVHRGAIDHAWRRTSYSRLLGSADQIRNTTPTVSDQADELRVTHDERNAEEGDEDADPRSPAAVEAVVGAADPPPTAGERPWWRADDGRDLRSVPLPLAEVRGSAELGTMLHAVLEHTDLAADDLDAELAHRLDAERRRHGVPADREALLAGLRAAVGTPLGPLADERTLAGTPWSDRLDEPRFELPVAGGDRPTPMAAPIGAIGELLAAHLAADDPLATYPARLRDEGPRGGLRGYLNGAIDLILRVGQDPAGRYVVIDHKTNRLGWPATPTAADYRPAALADAMQGGHYPLQALFYSVALHRLLRGRMRDYDPGHHLGGVLYLFLRGMTGSEVPRVDGAPCGVFAWRPPVALITDLDALLAGRWSPKGTGPAAGGRRT